MSFHIMMGLMEHSGASMLKVDDVRRIAGIRYLVPMPMFVFDDPKSTEVCRLIPLHYNTTIEGD